MGLLAIALPESDRSGLELIGHGSDKYLAARWYSRDWQHRIVWIEDGFWLSALYDSSMGKAVKWAENNSQVQLIDTSPTIEQHRKGYKKGIKHWNIKQICDALDIQQSRELLLNQIKAPISESPIPKLTNVVQQEVAPLQIDDSKVYLEELLEQQMNTSGKTATIVGAVAGAAAIIGVAIVSLLIFQRNDTIALTEHWTVVEVTGGDTMLVRQADVRKMNVRLCGINALQASVEATKKL